MSYCPLEEAYGKDFYNQVNNIAYKKTQYDINNLNPSRNYSYVSPLTNSQDTQQYAMYQSKQDSRNHRNSFNSTNPDNVNKKRLTAWGDEESEENDENDENDKNENNGNNLNNENLNQLSPREYLKQSLLKDRIIKSPDYEKSNYEPKGFSSINNYKQVENSECEDYFFHLDTCKKCQSRMKKRVMKYFKLLKKNGKLTDNYFNTGANDMKTDYVLDRELFSDNSKIDNSLDNKDNKNNKDKTDKTNKDDIEHFTQFNDSDPTTKGVILLLFGLFIIYTIDSFKK